jgi:hypothetical protein
MPAGFRNLVSALVSAMSVWCGLMYLWWEEMTSSTTPQNRYPTIHSTVPSVYRKKTPMMQNLKQLKCGTCGIRVDYNKDAIGLCIETCNKDTGRLIERQAEQGQCGIEKMVDAIAEGQGKPQVPRVLRPEGEWSEKVARLAKLLPKLPEQPPTTPQLMVDWEVEDPIEINISRKGKVDQWVVED